MLSIRYVLHGDAIGSYLGTYDTIFGLEEMRLLKQIQNTAQYSQEAQDTHMFDSFISTSFGQRYVAAHNSLQFCFVFFLHSAFYGLV